MPDTLHNSLQIYEKWKSDVVTLERIILRSFGFILHVEHPHKYVLNYMVILEVHDIPESGLLQQAWNLANDRFVFRLPNSAVFDYAPGSLQHQLNVLLDCYAV